MTNLFGAQVYDMIKLTDDETCGGIPAFDFHAKIECQGGEVEGYFGNGDPAIVTNHYGKGKTILYGSNLFDAYQLAPLLHGSSNPKVITWKEGEPLRNELRKRLADAGVQPTHELFDVEDDSIKNIQISFRKLPDGGRLLFVVNMDDKPNHFAMRFDNMTSFRLLSDSEDGQGTAITPDKLSFSLNDWGWSVLYAAP